MGLYEQGELGVKMGKGLHDHSDAKDAVATARRDRGLPAVYHALYGGGNAAASK